jgi:RNA-directed DNA polymerase
MSRSLGIPTPFIEALARSASYEYKTYKIPKRAGGDRTIHHPSRRLKSIQRWLLANVISKLPVHDAASAYRKNRSIFDNASRHATSKYLLRMDLVQFFPSIKQVDLAKYIADRPSLFSSWSERDIDTFCRLVCRNGALTIGAPTSPALSNALCYDLDVELDSLSRRMNVTYTRYADDLFFSTTQANVLREIEEEVPRILRHITVPASLALNPVKTRHSSKRGARRVTGIILGSDGQPHIGRKLKRRIRALIHTYGSLDGASKASLAGLIAYAIGLDPAFMNALIDKYGVKRIREIMAARAGQ